MRIFKKENILIFSLYVLISFIFGIAFYKIIYSPDGYSLMRYGVSIFKDISLMNVRPLQYVMVCLLLKIIGNNASYELAYRINLTASLILLAIGMSILYIYIIRINNSLKNKMDMKRRIVLFSAIVLMFFNRYIGDNLVFFENVSMIFALIIALIASIVYSEDVKHKNLICFVLLILSEFSYQTMIVAFVLFTLLFYILKNDDTLQLKYIFKTLILSIIPLVLLFVFSKVLEFYGVSVADRIMNIKDYAICISNYLILLVVYISAYFIYFSIVNLAFKKKFYEKKASSRQLLVVIFIVIIYNLAFALVNKGELSYRMCWSIGALAGTILIYALIKEKISCLKILPILIVFLTIEVGIYIYVQMIYVNYNEKVAENVENVISYIEKYNNEHETKIEKIATYTDSNITESQWYSVVPYLSFKIYNFEDLFVDQLNIYMEYEIIQVEKEEEYVEYFSKKDWDDFNEEEFIVNGDTLHFCKF